MLCSGAWHVTGSGGQYWQLVQVPCESKRYVSGPKGPVLLLEVRRAREAAVVVAGRTALGLGPRALRGLAWSSRSAVERGPRTYRQG